MKGIVFGLLLTILLSFAIAFPQSFLPDWPLLLVLVYLMYGYLKESVVAVCFIIFMLQFFTIYPWWMIGLVYGAWLAILVASQRILMQVSVVYGIFASIVLLALRIGVFQLYEFDHMMVLTIQTVINMIWFTTGIYLVERFQLAEYVED